MTAALGFFYGAVVRSKNALDTIWIRTGEEDQAAVTPVAIPEMV